MTPLVIPAVAFMEIPAKFPTLGATGFHLIDRALSLESNGETATGQVLLRSEMHGCGNLVKDIFAICIIIATQIRYEVILYFQEVQIESGCYYWPLHFL